MHTTNYKNTLIEVAEDCSVTEAQIPPDKKDGKTIAGYQFEMISQNPYVFTSDDIIFSFHALRKEIPQSKWPEEREVFFSKGQACLRSSPLPKRYGWGVHHNSEGKVALLAIESSEYRQLQMAGNVTKVKAMRSSRNYRFGV